jgi:hypothetical protein
MDFISPVFDLYSNYQLVNQGQTTATGLAALVEGKLSHDATTRSLHQQDYASRQLWQAVKPFVDQTADADSVLILDDTEQGVLYLVSNDLTSMPERADRVSIQTQYARHWKVDRADGAGVP